MHYGNFLYLGKILLFAYGDGCIDGDVASHITHSCS